MALVKPTMSSELSIDNFLLYKGCNQEMPNELIEFYELCKSLQPPQQQNRQASNLTKLNAVNDIEWKRHEAKNWLTENKKNRDEDEKLYSQVRSILNKLSDDNFDVLVEEIKKLAISDEIHLSKLSEFIFNKALDEPKFCVRYAKLAVEFTKYEPYNNDIMCFRTSIVKRCQIMFNEIKEAPKDKAKGCVSFIGELYNYNLLPNNIINYCFNELIIMCENTIMDKIIECIFTLMKISGGKFCMNNKQDSNIIFDKINLLVKEGNLCNKDKFSLMDTLDLKKKYEKK
jgi:translation initiation factor 4G